MKKKNKTNKNQRQAEVVLRLRTVLLIIIRRIPHSYLRV